MDNVKLRSILESVLFAKGEPASFDYLAKVIGVKKKMILTAIDELEKYYQENSSGLALLRKSKAVQLVTNSENAEYVEKVIKKDLQSPLSKVALEVLAIIAYRGPISRLEIESIRGVNSSFTLRNLLMRGLITRNVNAEDQRGYLYEISFDFLKKMGVKNIKELPDYEKLSRDGRVESIINLHSENK